jgi:plasmid stabilization system protein ParE
VTPYVVAPGARADLDRIWDYIVARASAEVATDFVWKFHGAFRTIASSPRAGVDMPGLPPGDVRKFPMGNYLTYYRALPGKIVIARVLHGKRRQRRAFLGKPE